MLHRYFPALVVLLLLAILALLYGPQMYRNWTFQRDVEAMLAAARSGNTPGIVRAIDPAQQREAQRIFDEYLPKDYSARITRLSLTSSEDSGPGVRRAIVTCRLEDSGNIAIYQGKFLWRWNGRRWDWDFTGSYAGPFNPGGEPQWYKLSEIIEEARAY